MIFKPIELTSTNVGKFIKSSKKRLSWTFAIESESHQIDLFLSRVSGKRVVYLDGYVVSRNSKDPKFYGAYPVKIKKFTFVVFEFENNKFDVRLGNFSFSEELTKLNSPHHGEERLRRDSHKAEKLRKKSKEKKIRLDIECIKEPQVNESKSPKTADVHRYNPFDDVIEGDEYSHKVIETNQITHSPPAHMTKQYKTLADHPHFPVSSASPLNIFDETFDFPQVRLD